MYTPPLCCNRHPPPITRTLHRLHCRHLPASQIGHRCNGGTTSLPSPTLLPPALCLPQSLHLRTPTAAPPPPQTSAETPAPPGPSRTSTTTAHPSRANPSAATCLSLPPTNLRRPRLRPRQLRLPPSKVSKEQKEVDDGHLAPAIERLRVVVYRRRYRAGCTRTWAGGRAGVSPLPPLPRLNLILILLTPRPLGRTPQKHAMPPVSRLPAPPAATLPLAALSASPPSVRITLRTLSLTLSAALSSSACVVGRMPEPGEEDRGECGEWGRGLCARA